MRSDGLGRVLACILAGLIFGNLGSMTAAFLGPFFFLSSPDSSGAENGTVLLWLVFFLLSGSAGVALCWRLTAGLPERQPDDQDIGIVVAGTRWLAVATGLVAGVTSVVSLDLYSVVLSSILIVGAIGQPHFRRHGFWLMLVPAVWVSSRMLPVGCWILFGGSGKLSIYHGLSAVLLASLWASSCLLLTCCDAALISEGSKLELLSRVQA
jgi:hypothetical protein